MVCSVFITGQLGTKSSSINEHSLTRGSRTASSDNWSDPIPLSAIDDNSTKNPEIEVFNNYVHVIWEENYNILYRRSEDFGETWSDIITLVSDQEYNATTPDIAVEGNNVYIVWVDEEIIRGDYMNEVEDVFGEIYYKYSSNNGVSWGNDFRITGDHSHFPCIDVKNDEIHIVWSENNYYVTIDLTTLYKFKIYYNKFENNDWQTPILLNESTKWHQYYGGFKPNPGVKANLNYVHIVWRGQEWNGTFDVGYILYINSYDNGNNWNDHFILSRNDISAFSPELEVKNDNVYVVFLEWSNQVRFIKSDDNGLHWGDSKSLSGNEMPFYYEGLGIALQNNEIHVSWSNNIEYPHTEIFISQSFNYGNTWNNATQVTNNESKSWYPQIGIEDGYLHVIWLDIRDPYGDDLYYKHYYKNTSIEIVSFNNTIILEDQYYEQELICLNADGIITWSVESNSSWLSFDKMKKSIFGTPTNKDVGTYWVNITASDSFGDIDELNITLTVQNVNDAPVIEGAPRNITVIQTEPIKLDLSFYIYDIDNSTSDLSLQTSSKYIKTEGLELYLDYRKADIMYENVTINVTDGELVSNNHYLEVEILLVDAWNVEIEDYSTKGNNVSIFSNITITFNRLMNHSSCEKSFKITPSISGEFNWNHNILTFYPANFLKYNISYTISIDTAATSIEGHPLDSNFSWGFTTEIMTSVDSDKDGYPDEIDSFPDNPEYYLDTDKDGMPNAWEDEHGLNKTDPADAMFDPDDDGKPNKDEFDDDTDPFVSDKDQEKEIDYMIFIAINIIILIVLVFIIILFKIKKKNKK